MMEIFARIGTIFRSDVGDRLFSELVRIHPEGQTGRMGHAFWTRQPLEAKRTRDIIHLLEVSGMRPWLDTSRPKDRQTEFNYFLEYEYGSSDLAECSLLELRPPDEARNREAMFRSIAGEMIVPEEQTPDGFDILLGFLHWYFVPGRAKEVLESGMLRHVIFRPTVYVPHLLDLDESGEAIDIVPDLDSFARQGRRPDDPVPYWELDSDFTLPPRSLSLALTDPAGWPVGGGDFSRGFRRREGLYIHPELHYRASDLEGLEPFDLARTYEPSGNRHGYDPLDRPLVASRRFYDYCVQHGLRTGWIPVRIDPE